MLLKKLIQVKNKQKRKNEAIQPRKPSTNFPQTEHNIFFSLTGLKKICSFSPSLNTEHLGFLFQKPKVLGSDFARAPKVCLGKLVLSFLCYFVTVFLVFLILICGAFFPLGVQASQIDELKSKISMQSIELQKVEKEIEKWEEEIEVVGQEKQSLSRDVRRLNTTRKKLNSDIYLTGRRITTANLNIEKLGLEINEKEDGIQKNSLALAEAIRVVNEQEKYTLLEILLLNDTLSEFWNDLEGLQKVQAKIKDKTNELKKLKSGLVFDKKEVAQKEKELVAHKITLSDKKEIVEYNKAVKNKLLSETKNKESNYQKILTERELSRQKLETELRDFEAQLEYISDKSKLPKKGSRVLAYPTKKPVITQRFGLTPFAKTGAYGYDKNGQPNPHRGVDFRASTGVDLLATAPGTVRDTENMDAYPGCVSYGKWVLIDHNNGLSTFYAHLSKIRVKPGQKVNTGDLVGFSGSTGYCSPIGAAHLHFSVFDKSAVKVGLYTWSNGCKKARVAYAPLDAYLDPMDYLVEYEN